MLGAIQFIEFKDSLLREDGALALDQEKLMVTVGLDGYALPEIIDRLNYAEPGKKPSSIKDGS